MLDWILIVKCMRYAPGCQSGGFSWLLCIYYLCIVFYNFENGSKINNGSEFKIGPIFKMVQIQNGSEIKIGPILKNGSTSKWIQN